MRILYLLSQMPDFTGSGKYVQEMIRQGRSQAHDVFLVAGVSADFVVPQELIAPDKVQLVRFDGHDLGFPVMGMSDVMPYPSTICSTMTQAQCTEYKNIFAQAIDAAIAQFAPDLIHSNHLWMATAVGRQVASHLPLVVTCHGSCLRQHALCPDLGQSLKSSLQGIDRIIALFEQQKTDIIELLNMDPDKVEVISGGYNQFCFYGSKTRTAGQDAQILYAGKLDSSKGVPWLLKSLTKVHQPWHLHLVGSGSGPEKDLCLALAANHGEHVTIHGALSHEALGQLMRSSDIFVLPSFFEGMPLVLLEAMACGCRIITTDLPGARELFATSHAHMVRLVELPRLETVDKPFAFDEPLLETRLAEALEKSIMDVQNNIDPDENYVRKITELFTWEKIFMRIEAIYGQAVREK